MNILLIIIALLIISSILFDKLSHKIGIPTLLLFIVLGMLFGSDGLFKIPFDDYPLAEKVCSVALLFIMFYGGFGTNWKVARPVAGKALVMSTLGVAATAILTGAFCCLVLKMEWLEGLLIGSVISSTDAASVFSILRSKKLNLKGGLASLLEIESGSNDPVAYLMVIIVLSLMSGSSVSSIPYLLFSQIVYGLGMGFLIGITSVKILEKINFGNNGLNTVFVFSVALLAYALPASIGGNGYLSVYLAGIILGNSKISDKITLVHFFDGITNLMQIFLFFLLGLLSFPSRMPQILLTSLAIALFLTLIARPAAVGVLLSPLRVPFRQQLLISFAGLRGAAAIVFAIFVTVSKGETQYDIFHIVFCVSLLSVALQGTLLPWISGKLGLIDTDNNVLKTFTDYQDDTGTALIQLKIGERHPWIGKTLTEINLIAHALVVIIKRGEDTLIPQGNTEIQQDDILILSCETYQENIDQVSLSEITITSEHEWNNKQLSELSLPLGTLVVMVKRKRGTIIPKGDTRIRQDDILIMSESSAE